MPHPRVLILRAPGTNCDLETSIAFERCGAVAERIHLFRWLEQPQLSRQFQILCVPGGFSYGDDIGAGVVFGHQLRGRLRDALQEFLTSDKLVLGICNGFQVLMKSGILPGGGSTWPPHEESRAEATLTWNDNGKYTARWVSLRASGSNSVFLRGVETVDLPIAHAEGKIAVRRTEILDEWQTRNQIALRYVASDEEASAPVSTMGLENRNGTSFSLPYNPNGSAADIAGLSDPSGRVLGLMPHPERFIEPTQHPRWTRWRELPTEGAGLRIFRNGVEYFR